MKTDRNFMNILCVFFFLLFVVLSSGCVSTLSVQEISLSEVADGSYSVITYRGAGPRDLDSIVILDLENDPLRFETDPPLPATSRSPGKSRSEALVMAVDFLRHHAWFSTVQISALKHADNRMIGYEIRPIYQSIHSGDSDPLLVRYTAGDAGTMLFRVDFRRTEEAFEQDRRR